MLNITITAATLTEEVCQTLQLLVHHSEKVCVKHYNNRCNTETRGVLNILDMDARF